MALAGAVLGGAALSDQAEVLCPDFAIEEFTVADGKRAFFSLSVADDLTRYAATGVATATAIGFQDIVARPTTETPTFQEFERVVLRASAIAAPILALLGLIAMAVALWHL